MFLLVQTGNPSKRRHHLGQRLRQVWAEGRSRSLHYSGPIEEGQSLLGLTELHEKPVERLDVP